MPIHTIFEDQNGIQALTVTKGTFIPGMVTTAFTTALSIINKTIGGDAPRLGAMISYQHDTSAKKATLQKIESAEFCHRIAHTNTAHLWSNVEPANRGIKVLVSLTGSMMKARVNIGDGTSHVMGFIPVTSQAEAEMCLIVIKSKLYRFMVQSCRYSASIPAALFKALPGVDLTRLWTDAELYAHFNLTQEEIDLIEMTVK